MNRKLKVGILGLGRAGRLMHAPELAQYPDLFEIKAGCDNAPDRRRDLPECMKNAKTYSDPGEMFADPELDLITVATRNADHVPHAIQALEAGKFVVVDKPVAVGMEQFMRLKAAAEQHPGKLYLRFNRRYEPQFNHIREILKTKVLGKIGMIKIYRHPIYARRFDWQTLTEFKGGMLNNWGPHIIDQALQLLESPVVNIWSNLQHRFAAGDADDQVKLLLTAKNGCVADLEISSLCALPGNLYEIWGDRGTLVVPNDGKTIHLRYINPKQVLPPLEPVRGNFPLMRYGNPEVLDMVERTESVRPMPGHTLQRGRVVESGVGTQDTGYYSQDTMWLGIYDAVVNGIPYPITLEDGMEVVRITEEAHRQNGF